MNQGESHTKRKRRSTKRKSNMTNGLLREVADITTQYLT